MECINIGLVTRGINEYGMREEGVTFYIGLYPTTITKARYYYIQRNRLRMDKMPHLKLVEQSYIEALHGATLTTESGLRCSMRPGTLTQSYRRLAILFHTWTGLLLDEPALVVPILLLYLAHCQ